MKKLTARKLALGLALGATAIGGAAYAEQAHGNRDADRIVTRADAQKHAEARFARMDANKDGKLDQADREARRNLAFDRLDTDKNGQISRAEFNTRPQRGPDGDHAKRGPGHGPGEGGKHFGWGGRGRGHHGGMMMGEAGKDGSITQAEFTAAALQRFDATDTNKDGQVTKEERQAAHQAMREQWRSRSGGQGPAPAAPAKPAG